MDGKISFMDLYWSYVLGYIMGIYLCIYFNFQETSMTWLPISLGILPCILTFMLYKYNYNIMIWVPRLITFIVILLIYLVNSISWRPFFMTSKKINSVTKINNYYPLTTDYGRTVEEIKRVMHIEDLPIRGNPTNLKEMWFALTHDQDNVQAICKEIFGKLPGNLAETYDLLWLMMISDNPHGNRLTKSQLASLVSVSNKRLQSLLPASFPGSKDRPSLLFAIMSGYYVVNNQGIRYHKIAKYKPDLMYNLTVDKLIDDDQAVYLPIGPYSYLSTLEENRVEKLLSEISEQNVEEIANHWGILIPNGENKVEFLKEELSSYSEVINRGSKPEYPDITGLGRSQAENLLLKFTNQELIEHYEPRQPWKTRKELIEVIFNDFNGDPCWSLTAGKYCTNNDTINILTGELRGETPKDDENDPTLSYGTHKNYRCYQMSELVGCFDLRDGVFLFSVPDYTPGAPFPREFPVESIKKLLKLLENNGNRVYQPLIDKIKYGLSTISDAKQRIRILKEKFDNFSKEHQELCQLYLAWTFCYGMWMRFWKGPGNAWPVKAAGNVSPETRDRHVIVQDLVRTRIVEKYEKNPALKEWIEGLPVIWIDLTSNEPASCSNDTLYNLNQEVIKGNYCMGFSSDHFLKTAYYYITELLGYKEGKRFNDFINHHIHSLLELEQHVLDNIDCKDDQMTRVVQDRLFAIQQGFENQPGFTSYNFRNNRHVN